MHIWLLTDGEPIPSDGTNPRLLHTGILASKLVERNNTVTWWISTFEHVSKTFRYNHNTTLNLSEKYTLKLLHSCGYKKNISLKRFVHNYKVAKQFMRAAPLEKKPDIIIAHLPPIDFALAATKFGKKYNIPVVLDLRDMWPDIMVEVMPRFLRPFARFALQWQYHAMHKTCKNSTAMIAPTTEFLKWGLGYAQRGISQLDQVFPTGYLSENIPDQAIASAEIFWDNLGITKNASSFIIAFVGSLQPTLQLAPFIEAINQMRGDIKLVIAGENGLLPLYKKMAAGNNNILFPGWIDHPKIHVLLKRSSLGIAPYIRRKDFNLLLTNKVGEYLAAGLPILTSLYDGVLGRLLLEKKCGDTYENNEVYSIVEKLTSLINHPHLLKQMSGNARALYEQMFEANKIYNQLYNYLEMIVKNQQNKK